MSHGYGEVKTAHIDTEEEEEERIPCEDENESGKENNKEEEEEGKKEVGSLMRRVVIAFLKFWRVFVSPLYPPSCRFYPTCSEYAILAVEKYGVFKGLSKALWRVIRCNPWSRGGVDPP